MEASDEDGPPPSKKEKTLKSETLCDSKSSSVVLDDIKILCKKLKCSDSIVKQFALQRLRELISNNHQFPIEALIENNIVHILAELLKAANLDIRHNAAKILAFMTTGTPEQTNVVINEPMLLLLMDYAESLNVEVCNDALEIITNVVAAGPCFRDLCLHLGIIEKLLNAPFDALSDTTKVMNLICQDPCPDHNVILPFLVKMDKCIQHEDDAIRANSMNILYKITNDASNKTKKFVLKRLFPLLVRLLDRTNLQIHKDILLIFQNIVKENNFCNEIVIKTGIISPLIKLLTSRNKNLLKLTFEILGSFVSSGLKACEHCVQCGILESLVTLTKNFEPDTLLAKAVLIKIFCQNYGLYLLPESACILLRCLFTSIFNSNDDIVVCALDSISYFNSDQTKHFQIPQHVYDRFIQLFNHMEKNVRVSAYYAFVNIINCCYPQMQPQMIFNTTEMLDLFIRNGDPLLQEKAMYFLLKSMEDNTNVNVPAKILQECVKLLDADSFKLQQLAANILEKISGGTKEQNHAVLLLNPVVPLIRILKSTSIDVRIAALRFLTNIIEFYLHEDDNCTSLKITNSLLNLLKMTVTQNVMRNFAKILFQIFREPLPDQNIISAFFPFLLKCIQNANKKNFIINLLLALSTATKGRPEVVYLFIEEKMVQRLVGLLKHDDFHVNNTALMVLDVISCQDKNHLISCGILKEIKNLFSECPNEKINANGLLLLSKMANGNKKEIQAIYDEKDLVSIILHFFKNEKLNLQLEAWDVILCLINGNAEQVMKLINMGFVPVFLDLMTKYDVKSLIPFLKSFRKICKKVESNVIRQEVTSNGGIILFNNWFENGDEQLRVIIYECMNILGLNLSSAANNLSLSDF